MASPCSKNKIYSCYERKKGLYTHLGGTKKTFFKATPHLHAMATFAVNTGCREQEVCGLRWEWEFPIPELETSIFVLPSEVVKNGQERIVILNTLAKEVIQKQRAHHDTFVFTYRSRRLHRIHNSGWKKAWKNAGLPNDNTILRGVHNLRHTFDRRLRAAGVTEEDRKDLLGHKYKSLTTHYSMAEIKDLIDSSNKVCEERLASPVITALKASSRKSPARNIGVI